MTTITNRVIEFAILIENPERKGSKSEVGKDLSPHPQQLPIIIRGSSYFSHSSFYPHLLKSDFIKALIRSIIMEMAKHLVSNFNPSQAIIKNRTRENLSNY